jgi:alpha-L-fucosidase
MWNAVNTVDSTIWSRPAATKGDKNISNDYGLLETGVNTGHPLGKFWRNRECTTNKGFHEGGWFWHPEGTYPRSLADHVELYYRTVGLGAITIIYLPPDYRGLVPDDIAAAAKAFGDEIKARFANPVAVLNQITVDNVVELAWEELAGINTVVTMENIANGQKIAKYTLEAFVGGQWITLEARNELSSGYNKNPGFETIGHKKIDRVAPVVTNKIRFRCLEAVVEPVEIRRLAVYNCKPFDFAN